MVEISDTLIFIVALVSVFGISILMLRNHYDKKTRSIEVEQTPNGVRKRAVKGQEDAVDTMKELTTDSIVFLKDEIKDLRTTIKRLKSSVSWYKSQMYGDGRVDDMDEEGKPTPLVKVNNSSNVSEDVINMRLKLITERLNLPQEILMFDEIKNGLYEIAASPNFEQIAATGIKLRSQTTQSDTNAQNINYV